MLGSRLATRVKFFAFVRTIKLINFDVKGLGQRDRETVKVGGVELSRKLK